MLLRLENQVFIRCGLSQGKFYDGFLPYVIEVFEKLIQNRLKSFLPKHTVIFTSQFVLQ